MRRRIEKDTKPGADKRSWDGDFQAMVAHVNNENPIALHENGDITIYTDGDGPNVRFKRGEYVKLGVVVP